MEFDNAINLDRKSGIRGTKKTGGAPTIAFAIVEVSNHPLHKRRAKYGAPAQCRPFRVSIPFEGVYPVSGEGLFHYERPTIVFNA
jgi:hypothetical protein